MPDETIRDAAIERARALPAVARAVVAVRPLWTLPIIALLFVASMACAIPGAILMHASHALGSLISMLPKRGTHA